MNAVSIIGRLTQTPELKQTPSGKNVATLRLAVDSRREEHTDYFDVQVWEKQAIVCTDHLVKGTEVAVTGRLAHETWKADDDTGRSRVYIVAHDVDFLRRAPSQEPAPESGTPVAA